MRKPKRGDCCLKTLILVSIVVLISYSLLQAEEKRAEASSLSKSNIVIEESVIQTCPTPLETKPPLNLNLSPLFPKKQYNFNLRKGETKFIHPLAKISRLNDIENSLFTASLISLAALNTVDCLSTISALKYPGLQEANPIMKPLSKNAWLLTAVKAGITVYNYHCLKNLYKKNKKLAWIISLAANMAMTYIVVNNFRMIQEARSK